MFCLVNEHDRISGTHKYAVQTAGNNLWDEAAQFRGWHVSC